jgi:general L-amino acid transport system permease protein
MAAAAGHEPGAHHRHLRPVGIIQLNLTDAKWFANSTTMTGLIFAGFAFWVFCFGMSRYSQMIERRLARGDRR